VKKAVPLRLPDCPEGDLPTTKQVEFYLLLWERQRKPLARDPGPGFSQKSFWLDPEELDADAYDTECFRAGRPDRALFIRRLIATYHKHKRTTSKPMSIATPSAPGLAAQTVFRSISRDHASDVRAGLSTVRGPGDRTQRRSG
jgi:hypothetical protein